MLCSSCQSNHGAANRNALRSMNALIKGSWLNTTCVCAYASSTRRGSCFAAGCIRVCHALTSVVSPTEDNAVATKRSASDVSCFLFMPLGGWHEHVSSVCRSMVDVSLASAFHVCTLQQHCLSSVSSLFSCAPAFVLCTLFSVVFVLAFSLALVAC